VKIISRLKQIHLIGPDCSFIHIPYSSKKEKKIDNKQLSFYVEKLNEKNQIKTILKKGKKNSSKKYNINKYNINRLKKNRSLRTNIYKKTKEIIPFKKKLISLKKIGLNFLPITTIGSFPQTPEIRHHRSLYLKGKINKMEYKDGIINEIKKTISIQEKLNINVLVHGESERSDMVEYFCKDISGCWITQFGWVQSYGTRCVKPPIIWGDLKKKKFYFC